ncbi:MAG: hypothetical protein J3K34DRAFT_83787 [Monoraphidium minutum]|nr:MAG: hypothetical protein J3K34DRAFT_83787 [Monoraphidium minutum]
MSEPQQALAFYPEPTPVEINPDASAVAKGGGGEPSGSASAGRAAPAARPPPFEYVQRMPAPPNSLYLQGGCTCTGPCGPDCPCAVAHKIGMAALLEPDGPHSVLALLECGPACACACKEHAGGCTARTTQRGVRRRLAVVPRPGKGWGVITREPLPHGAFVADYAGEYLNTAGARARASPRTTPSGPATRCSSRASCCRARRRRCGSTSTRRRAATWRGLSTMRATAATSGPCW